MIPQVQVKMFWKIQFAGARPHCSPVSHESLGEEGRRDFHRFQNTPCQSINHLDKVF